MLNLSVKAASCGGVTVCLAKFPLRRLLECPFVAGSNWLEMSFACSTARPALSPAFADLRLSVTLEFVVTAVACVELEFTFWLLSRAYFINICLLSKSSIVFSAKYAVSTLFPFFFPTNPPVFAIVEVVLLSLTNDCYYWSKLLSSFAKTIILTLFAFFKFYSFNSLLIMDFDCDDLRGEFEFVFGVVPLAL